MKGGGQVQSPIAGPQLPDFSSDQSAESGFVAVDALVGLAILAVSIGLTLQAVHTANKLAMSARNYRQAALLLSHMSGPGFQSTGDVGQSGGLGWKVTREDDPETVPVRLCRRTIEITEALSHKVYSTQSVTTCAHAQPGDAP